MYNAGYMIEETVMYYNNWTSTNSVLKPKRVTQNEDRHLQFKY